jgi:hypothetical protein
MTDIRRHNQMLFSAVYEFKYPPNVSLSTPCPETQCSPAAAAVYSGDFVAVNSSAESDAVFDFSQSNSYGQPDSFMPTSFPEVTISAAAGAGCNEYYTQVREEEDHCFTMQQQAAVDVNATHMQDYFAYNRTHHAYGLDTTSSYPTNGLLSYSSNSFFC